MESEVLTLLLTARYVGSPAFNALGRDIDTLVNSTSQLEKFGAGVSMVGMGITAATVGVAALAGEAIKYASQFQDSMQRIQSVLPAGWDPTGNWMQSLQTQIVQTSDRYGQSVDQIATGTYFLMSALQAYGYTAQDVIKQNIVPAFGAFIVASGHGLAGSIDWVNGVKQVVHVLGAMHQPVSQWTADLAAMTAVENTSSLSQNNLVTALQNAAPMAGLAKMPFNQLLGIIGAEAESGVYGGRAGTDTAAALRMFFTSPTSAAALQSLGLSRNQFLTKGGGLIDMGTLFTIIQSKLAGVSDPAQRIKLASQIFGAVGFRGFGPLLQEQMSIAGGQGQYYANIMNAIKSRGIASMFGVADSQMSSFAQQVARLAANFHNFLMLIGGPLITALTPVISKLADALSHLNDRLMSMSKGPGGLSGGLSRALGWLPGAVFGTIGAGAILGPGLQFGGGWLRDFAGAQDAAHASTLKRLLGWEESTGLGRANLLATQDIQRRSLASDLEALLLGSGGGGGATALDKGPRSAFMNALATQRIDYLRKYMSYTDSGLLGTGAGVPDRTFQQLVKAADKSGPQQAFSTRKAWDYVNNNWKQLQKAYGLGSRAGPNEAALERQMTLERGATPQASIDRLTRRQASFEERAAQQLKNFDKRASLNMPNVEPSASAALKDMFTSPFKGVWDFGKKISPYHLFQQHLAPHIGPTMKYLSEFDEKHWPVMREAMGEGLKSFGRGVKAAPGVLWGGIKAAPGALLSGIKAIPDGIINGIAALAKGFGSVVSSVGAAIPAIMSFSSVLLPLVAIALLIAGVIVIAVLAFTRYRKETLALGQALLTGLTPVFKYFMSIVLSVLRQITQAWHAHQKQIDAAMKGLMGAIKAAIPFFQVMGVIIATVIGIIIKVIGYLVLGFINALPSIIGVFQAIFNILGDLGRIVMDVIHGKWGAAWDDARALLGHAVDLIKNILTMLWTFFGGVFGSLWNDIKGPLSSFWNNLVGWFQGLGKGIQRAFAGALSGLGSVLHNAVAAIPGGAGLAKLLHIPGFAAGGYVDQTKLAVVGERGPELVMLPGGSRVYNHRDSMDMASHALQPFAHGYRAQQESLKDEFHALKEELKALRPAKRSPAEEYFFARQVQERREAVWNRFPHTMSAFDDTYRKAYQYYG